MRRILALAFFSFLLSVPLALAADGPSPFQLTYQPGEMVSYPEAIISSTTITLLNRSGDEVSDVAVSIPAQEPVSDYTLVLGFIPDGYTKEFLKTVPATGASASASEASVVWHVEYTNAAGEHAALDLVAEPAN